MGSKSRGNSNIPNRLSVADRTELLTKTGTREGEVILQADIGLTYTWTDTQGVDNGGTILNVGTGSWVASYGGSISVRWFGAVGDGTTDDYTAIQNALNEASGTTLYFPDGTYRCDTNIIGYTNTSIIGLGGATIDFSQRPAPLTDLDVSLFAFRGTTDAEILLTRDAEYATNKIGVPDSSLFSEGDLVEVSMADEGAFPDTSVITSSGQLNILIGDYDATNNLVLDTMIYDNYTTALGARIRKVNPVENITITGMGFKGTGRPASGEGDVGITVYYGRNINIKNCRFDEIDGRSCNVVSCYNFTFDSNIDYKEKLGDTDGISYGFTFSASTFGLISNNKTINARHAIVSSHLSTFAYTQNYYGISRLIVITNNKISGNYGDIESGGWEVAHAGISTHVDCELLTISSNEITTCKFGVNVRARNMKISDNTMSGCLNGIYFSGVPSDISISNNMILDTHDAGIAVSSEVYTSTVAMSNLKINDNKFIGGTSGIELSMNSVIRNIGLLVSNNIFTNLQNDITNYPGCVRVEGWWEGIVSNNVVTDCSVWGISFYLAGQSEVLISGNRFTNITDSTGGKLRKAMYFSEETPNTIVIGNVFKDNTSGNFTNSKFTQTINNMEM